MSLIDGLSALNLEMPEKIPRTEYSADYHWRLVSAVTGLEVNDYSDWALKNQATTRFRVAWNYGLIWNTLIFANDFGDMRSKMGYAVYTESGEEFKTETTQLFDDPEDVYGVDFDQLLGARDKSSIITRFNNDYKNATENNPDSVCMTGIYITCMSGLIDLLGWDTLLTAAGIDPKAFGDFTNRYANWISTYFQALAESDAPVVMIHDDIVWGNGPFLRLEWYREYIFPNLKRLFAPLREAGKKILFTSDGDYTMFINDLAGCGVHGFVLEPVTDMAYVAEKYGKTHVIVGNADTMVLYNGTKEDIYNEVKRCIDIGKNCPGYFLAVGNHIPANTPVENALYYNEVYEKLNRR